MMTRLFMLTAFVLAACGGKSPDCPPASSPQAFVSKADRWPTSTIAVCWEDLAQSTAGDRALVTTSLAAEITARAGITLAGWELCPTGDFDGIRVAVRDTTPKTRGLGAALRAKENGVLLNFTFAAWGDDCSKNEGVRQKCMKSTALHEFLHALGMAHENNRDDTPHTCHAEAQGPDGDTKVGAYDEHSVLNYCNTHWNNDGVMSDTDVAALRLLYATSGADVGAAANLQAKKDDDASACHS